MSSPKKIRLELSDPARADIEDILNYTYQHYGERQEEVYFSALCDAMDSVESNPHIGYEHSGLPKGYRVFPVEKHVMIYKLKGQTGYIARVLHERMDFSRHMLEDQ